MRQPRRARRAERRHAMRPPLRGGINASPVTLPDAEFKTLDDWLDHRFGAGSAEALSQGDVFADGGIRLTSGTEYHAGDRVWLFRPVPDEPSEPIILNVLFENDDVLAVDKPHDIATIPRGSFVARTVTVAARRQFGNDELVPAHRLDAGTAGVVLLTKRRAVRGVYQDLFAKRQVNKKYLAIAPALESLSDWTRVDLRLEKKHGDMRAQVTDGTANAHTDLRMLYDVGRGLALYDLRPLTGKTHQLRATMNHLGVPIESDPLFPNVLTLEETARRHLPLQLLASELELTDPMSGDNWSIKSRRVLALENPPRD